MKALEHQQGSIVLYLCCFGRKFSKLCMHLVGVKTSILGTLQQFITLAYLLLHCTSTANGKVDVEEEGSQAFADWTCFITKNQLPQDVLSHTCSRTVRFAKSISFRGDLPLHTKDYFSRVENATWIEAFLPFFPWQLIILYKSSLFL